MVDFLIKDNFRGIHHLPFLLMLTIGGQKVSHLFTPTSKYINSFEKVKRKIYHKSLRTLIRNAYFCDK